MTIAEALEWAVRRLQEASDSPRLDAEVLLAHALGTARSHLYAWPERELDAAAAQRAEALIGRRAEGVPVAYLTGRQEFWSLPLEVNEATLIPRPETELLVELALARLPAAAPCTVLDLGTGTGAIALALASERPDLDVAATDLAVATLELAKENAQALDLSERVSFFQGDLLDALPDAWRSLDMLVSNPPYIGTSERGQLMRDVRDFEPEGALFSGEDGLDILRRLIPASLDLLKPGAYLLLEIGYRQGSAVTGLLKDAGFEEIAILPDLAGRDRVARARRTASNT